MPFSLAAEHALQIAWKRDSHTIYDRHGKLTASSRVRSHAVQSLLDTQMQPHMLSLGNRVDCSVCGQRSDHQATGVIVGQPEYLSVQLVRMSYDPAAGRNVKTMTPVNFSPTLQLPAVQPWIFNRATQAIATAESLTAAASTNVSRSSSSGSDDSAGIIDLEAETDAPADASATDVTQPSGGITLSPSVRHLLPRISRGPVSYGLYAILVHRGDTANSGHYYAYARRSNAAGSDLSQPDDPVAPWLLLNDDRVSRVTWAEMRHTVLGSANGDTAYVLLYRRLTGRPAGQPHPLIASNVNVNSSSTAAGAAAGEATFPSWLSSVVNDNFQHIAARLVSCTSRFAQDATDA